MRTHSESDITYLTGYLDGILRAGKALAPDNRSFDPEQWADLSGSDIVYNTFTAYASDEDAKQGRHPLELMEWDEEREVAMLVEDAELPGDRSGEIVFPDGTVVAQHGGGREIYTVPEWVVRLLESVREHRLSVIRGVYDYDPYAPGR